MNVTCKKRDFFGGAWFFVGLNERKECIFKKKKKKVFDPIPSRSLLIRLFFLFVLSITIYSQHDLLNCNLIL